MTQSLETGRPATLGGGHCLESGTHPGVSVFTVEVYMYICNSAGVVEKG